MEKYKGSNMVHSFSRGELFVIVLVVLFVIMFAFPKARGVIGKIRLENAIDSAYFYKDSISKFYVNQLIVDSGFKFDGVYTISDGKLIMGDTVYNIMKGANVPTSGYLDYQNNMLMNGCIDVNGYSIVVENGDIVGATVGSCSSSI